MLSWCLKLLTCKELNTVNVHANRVVLLLTVRIPKAHVSPNKGRSTMDAINMALCKLNEDTLMSTSPRLKLLD